MYNTFTSEYTGEECIDFTHSSQDDVEDVTNEDFMNEDVTNKGYLGEPTMNSVDPKYSERGSNPAPGDLVISSLFDVKHPTRRHANFGNQYLIIGAVRFKGPGVDVLEAWKMGMEFKSYAKIENFVLTGNLYSQEILNSFKFLLRIGPVITETITQ